MAIADVVVTFLVAVTLTVVVYVLPLFLIYNWTLKQLMRLVLRYQQEVDGYKTAFYSRPQQQHSCDEDDTDDYRGG